MRNALKIVINCAATVMILILVSVFSAKAATFVVNTTADTPDATPGDGICADATPACSLRAAISEANALAGDDIITLPAGAYTQTLVAANDDANAGGDWDISSNITINGAGSATTFMQANAASGVATERVLNVRSGTVVVDGVTIRNGRFTGAMTASTRGGGVENLGTLTLSNSIVRDNIVSATSANPIGGGINNQGAALTLNGTTVTANSVARPASTGSSFGGGVTSLVASTLTITNSSISGNSAGSPTGFGFGAGLYLENVFNVTATNSHFDNNIGTASLSGSNGTGVRALSAVGAAVFNATNCTFNGNSGSGGVNQGQGLQFFTVTTAAATLTATLDGVSVNGNSGNGPGVGVNSQGNGGAINVTVRNSNITNNTGATNGGGVLITNTGSVLTSPATFNFLNSTISGNTATGNGGGVFIEQPTGGVNTANFNFTTVASNTAAAGGGVFRSTAGTVNLKNSIVADNTGGASPDLSGTVNSQDYNHFESVAGASITGTTTNNVTGSDPQLGALALNGGATLNHLPAGASPVVNTIPNGINDCGSPVVTDQRGITRPNGAGCEKGSVEIVAIAPGPWDLSGTVTNANGNPIRNVIITVSGGGLGSPIFTQTGNLGIYSFADLPGGTYTVSISAKRFTFTPPSQIVVLGSDLTNINFTADPGFGVRNSETKDN